MMVESFEEFLKRNSPLSYCGGLIPVILVRDLGEWAWKNVVIGEEERSQLSQYDVFREIAVTCLGKVEIEKRLKALNEKEKVK